MCAFVIVPLPAFAHHSFAMFDESRTSNISGVVEEFQMINPHSWLQLMAMDSQGKQREWSLEASAPGQLMRGGWQQTSLRPGDKVTVSIHPLKDGTNGGELLTVTLPDGHVLSAHKPPGGPQ
jgi:translation initiation factor IF-1